MPRSAGGGKEGLDMGDFLEGYSIQRWLESCPQGYLANTEYGHPAGEQEPEMVS